MTLEKNYTTSGLSDLIKEELFRIKNKDGEFSSVEMIEKIVSKETIEIDFNNFSDKLQKILSNEQTHIIHKAFYRAIFEIFQNQNPALADECKKQNRIKFVFVNGLEKLKDRIFERPDKHNEVKIEKTVELSSLTKIENPELTRKTVKVNAIIASNTISYNIPRRVLAKCRIKDNDHHCNKQYEFNIPINEKAGFVDIVDTQRFRILQQKSQWKFKQSCDVIIEELETSTLKKLRIRPIVTILTENEEGKIVDEEGNEYKHYDIYLEQNQVQSLEAGKEIEIVGTVIPDPKSQRITLIANKVEKIEDADYNTDNIKKLREQYRKLGSVKKIIEWQTIEFEKFSKINKRYNITKAGLLTFFSPIVFEFEGKRINGWMKSIIIGDSTTGKSETMRMLLILLKSGQMITGETASVVGLTATASQSSNNQWFVEWGALPLNDRRLLVIDGAHRLTSEQWASLAETERTGIINIQKAGKGQAKARTRQIKIMNPVSEDRKSTRPMKTLYYPIQSIINTLQLQSIARQDLAIFVMDDVKSKDRNKRNGLNHSPILNYLSDLLKLVWNQKFDIKIEEEAIDEILLKATELENKFKTEDIPLITNDQKYKLARLSVSLASLCCSFNDDFTELRVLKEHVDCVSDFIDSEYRNAGLDKVAKSNRDLQVDEDVISDIVYDIGKRLDSHIPEITQDDILKMLDWMATQTQFTKDTIMAKFHLSDKNEVRPLVSYLQIEGLIDRKNGFIPTNKLISVGKFIDGCKKSGVSPLPHGKGGKDGKRTLRCKNCVSTEWKTDMSLKIIEEGHQKTHKGHVLEEIES